MKFCRRALLGDLVSLNELVILFVCGLVFK